MNWDHHLAKRTALIKSSAVRDFLKHAARPEIISFAGGLPDPELLPVQAARSATERALTAYSSNALQYGATEGVQELREYVASRFNRPGLTAENVLITTGSQQALDLIGRTLLDAGDSVAVQNPTYLAALSAWRPYGVHFLGGTPQWPLPLSENGPLPDLVYCVPNFQNPTGLSLGQQDRIRLLDFVLRHELPLIEDDPYGALRYEGTALPSFLEMGDDKDGPVLHLGTFSKILAPGLRVGWIVGPRGMIQHLARAKQAMDLHTSTFCQYVALQLIRDGALDHLIPKLCSVYREKRDLLLNSLRDAMPDGATWTYPEGGYFLLLNLPSQIDGVTFARRALDLNIAVVPGADFHISGGTSTIRLSFSQVRREQIKSSVTLLATICSM